MNAGKTVPEMKGQMDKQLKTRTEYFYETLNS